MNAMRPARNYDLTEITRLLLKMRDNCVRKAEGEAYDDPERKEKYEALNTAIDLINNPSMLQRWISVKERLPEKIKQDDAEVRSSDLVAVVVCDDMNNIFVSDDILCESEWVNYPAPLFEVTHWIPLPELPKEVRQ